MNISTVKNWRKGQTIFNFLEWIKDRHPDEPNLQSLRMADPFYIEDAVFDGYFKEFLTEMEALKK